MTQYQKYILCKNLRYTKNQSVNENPHLIILFSLKVKMAIKKWQCSRSSRKHTAEFLSDLLLHIDYSRVIWFF